jgi:hypothetical protein
VGGYIIFALATVAAIAALVWWANRRFRPRKQRGRRRY